MFITHLPPCIASSLFMLFTFSRPAARLRWAHYIRSGCVPLLHLLSATKHTCCGSVTHFSTSLCVFGCVFVCLPKCTVWALHRQAGGNQVKRLSNLIAGRSGSEQLLVALCVGLTQLGLPNRRAAPHCEMRKMIQNGHFSLCKHTSPIWKNLAHPEATMRLQQTLKATVETGNRDTVM